MPSSFQWIIGKPSIFNRLFCLTIEYKDKSKSVSFIHLKLIGYGVGCLIQSVTLIVMQFLTLLISSLHFLLTFSSIMISGSIVPSYMKIALRNCKEDWLNERILRTEIISSILMQPKVLFHAIQGTLTRSNAMNYLM